MIVSQRYLRGLTLIETLLGFLILSIIALSLYGTFASGMSVNQKMDRYFSAQREASFTFSQMAADFNHLVSYDFSGSWPEKMCFYADDQAIEFLTATDQGLTAIRYELIAPEVLKVYETKMGRRSKKNETIVLTQTGSTSPSILIRREVPLTTFIKSGFEQAPWVVLSRRIFVDGFKISFSLPQNAKTTSGGWQPGWNSPFLPAGVKVELKIVDVSSTPSESFVATFLIPKGWNSSS